MRQVPWHVAEQSHSLQISLQILTSGSGRFDSLDGIRALAIGAVLSLHWLSWYSPFFHGGSIGVDIFFVLSGFIITTMLWRSKRPPNSRGRLVGLFVASLLLVMSCLTMIAGLILDGIRKARHEHSRLAYMRHPAVAITEPLTQIQPGTSQIPSMRRVGLQARAS